MKRKVDSLPNWSFWLDEVSAGVYRVRAVHEHGCSLEISGTDPDKLMERAEEDARRMEADLDRKTK